MTRKPKTTKSFSALKNRLRKTLPSQVMNALESYDDFSNRPIPEDAKGFTAHHNACRSAIVHAETLLKLAEWTADEDIPKNNNESPELDSILAEAKEQEDGDYAEQYE